MAGDERSSYLSERVYRQSGSRDFEHYEFWAAILGQEKVEYLKQRDPRHVAAFLSGAEFYSCNDISSSTGAAALAAGDSGREMLPQTIVFKEFYLPYIKAVYSSLAAAVGKVFRPSLQSSFCMSLVKQLEVICLRTLIDELHRCRDEELLTAGSPEAQYRYYVTAFLEDLSYRRELDERYPVMLRRISETMEQQVLLSSTILRSYEREKQQLWEAFFDSRDPGEVVDLQMNISDAHNQGKTVCMLHFCSGGKLVYKPRSLRNEQCYQQLAGFIAAGCGIEQYHCRIVAHQHYSWMEYVEYKSCTTTAELSGYYERLGAHLFVGYLLGGGDLHYENLIARGAYPVLLDMEVLLETGTAEKSREAAKAVLHKLQDSVLYRGILPFPMWNHNGTGINVSAIEGHGGQQVPFKVPVVSAPFTSRMKIEHISPTIEHSHNLPLLNGLYIEAWRFTDDLKGGFEKCYHYFLDHREAVLQQLDKLAGIRKRVLLRNTQEYSMYLTLSYHPHFLRDGGDREMILNSLFSGRETKREQWLVESEIRALLKGDIPYFYQFSDGTTIYNSSGEGLKNYCQKAPLKRIKERAARLSREDCEQQCRFIDLSMKLFTTKAQQHSSSEKPLFSDRRLAAASYDERMIEACVTAIADDILEAACYNDDYSEVSWIGMKLSENAASCWQIEPMSNRLHDGLSGLAVFFHAVTQHSGSKKYQKVGEALAKTLFRYTDSMIKLRSPASNTGIFTGESSLVYAYQLLYEITGQQQYCDYAVKHSRIVTAMLPGDSRFDLLSGNAGAVLALVNMFHLTAGREYLDQAAAAATLLFNNVIETGVGAAWPPLFGERPLLGFSHGTSGIIYALAKLYQYRSDAMIPVVLGRVLYYEDNCFDPQRGNWPDLRKPTGTGENAYMVAWCHGAAGILLSREGVADGLPGLTGKIAEIGIRPAQKALAGAPLLEHCCLCHGNIGNTAILEQYAERHGDSHTVRQCRGNYQQFAQEYLAGRIAFSAQEQNNYGFMTGLSGIGYYLLRTIRPELPDVLKLEIKRQK